MQIAKVLKQNAVKENVDVNDNIALHVYLIDAIRPFGNKDIPASIAFNLNWDFLGRLRTEYMPEFAQKEALQLLELLKEKLIQ